MSGLDVKAVPITDTTVLDYSPPPPALGPVVMLMPEGPALCHDARSCTCITGQRPSTGERFVVIAAVAEIDGAAVGTLVQFTPAEARRFAGSLIAGAVECEEGMV